MLTSCKLDVVHFVSIEQFLSITFHCTGLFVSCLLSISHGSANEGRRAGLPMVHTIRGEGSQPFDLFLNV